MRFRGGGVGHGKNIEYPMDVDDPIPGDDEIGEDAMDIDELSDHDLDLDTELLNPEDHDSEDVDSQVSEDSEGLSDEIDDTQAVDIDDLYGYGAL